MKHNDFIAAVKKLGLSVQIEDQEMIIAYDDYNVASVQMDIPHCMTQYAIEEGEDPDKLRDLFLLLAQYTDTPIAMRS